MKKSILVFAFILSHMILVAQGNNDIYLLVRVDDIGSFHAANTGCIETYKNGIAQSVELMAPCAWFLEAAKMLGENPGFDVGVHLTLTSEWSNVKWRPLTHCPSLVENDGYFFPMVWKNDNFPAASSIQESNWKIDEVEQELRAQIEISLKYVPHISHLTTHMGFQSLDPKITGLVEKLAKEYNLDVDMSGIKRFAGWEKTTYEGRIGKFCENLEKLTPGKYLFVEHPAEKSAEEMESVGHKGYENVAADREWVTRVLTSKEVKETIRKKNIKLISYKNLK